MSQYNNQDYDKTIVQFSSPSNNEQLPFTTVAVAPKQQSLAIPQYVAQQSSLDMFVPGINPLVHAASSVLTSIIYIQNSNDISLESHRNIMIAEIQAFNTHAKVAGFNEAQVNTAQYLLCTALDESVTTSKISGANENWQSHSLLSTFHKDTWGGELFFDVLDRAMKQPASRLHLLELMYILLSLGFEGKYRMQDRGSLDLESLRDQLYRQIRALRGEPSSDLAKKIPEYNLKTKSYGYISTGFISLVVLICLSVTFWGFSTTLDSKSQPILDQLSGNISKENLTNSPLLEERSNSPSKTPQSSENKRVEVK